MPPSATVRPHPDAAASHVREYSFELHVQPRDGVGYGLALHRRDPERRDHGPVDPPVVQIWGDPLLAVVDHVLGVIRRAGYRSTDLRPTRRAPFRVHEEDAVRLGVLFAALKPLRKHRRIDEVACAIRSMELEEAYYWFSKVATGPDRGRVQRALRIMVSDE